MAGFTAQEKRTIMETFNARGFTFAGAPVQLTGVSKDFPRAVIRRGHPLFGFSCEYSWGTILQICNGTKTEIAVAL